jgi:hypothetical protein
VQYALTHPLTHLCCSNNILLLALRSKPPHLVKIDLTRPDAEEVVDLPPAQAPFSIHNLFLDPTGKHILVSLSTSEVCYCYLPWPTDPSSKTKRAKPLGKLKGVLLEAVAWSPAAFASTSLTASSSKEVLVGTSDGRVLETYLDGELESSRPFGRSHHDRYANQILVMPERQAVRGLKYCTWQAKAGGSKRRTAVVATTATRILQYIASSAIGQSGGIFEQLASVYKDAVPSESLSARNLRLINDPESLELPSVDGPSQLLFWQSTKQSEVMAQTVAWLTGPGIYYGKLALSSQESGDGIIESAQLLPFPTSKATAEPVSYDDGKSIQAEVPVGMALTEFHFILLYATKVRIVRILDDETVFEENLELVRLPHPSMSKHSNSRSNAANKRQASPRTSCTAPSGSGPRSPSSSSASPRTTATSGASTSSARPSTPPSPTPRRRTSATSFSAPKPTRFSMQVASCRLPTSMPRRPALLRTWRSSSSSATTRTP